MRSEKSGGVADHLSVPEETILEACGEPAVPEPGIIEQVWETDPIASGELGGHAALAHRVR